MTVDEIIAALKKSSLPTIVVEGGDDIIVYRRLEERLAAIGISVFPAGGRPGLLAIFNRRAEIGDSIRVAFIADKDTWMYTGVPEEYQKNSLVLTAGYSIENDVFVDGKLLSLLTATEATAFRKDLSEFVRWYALALSRHLNDASESIAHHPSRILDAGALETLCAPRNAEQFPQGLYDDILQNFEEKLRGKSLMALLMRRTSKRNDGTAHSPLTLMDAVAANPGANLKAIATSVENFFLTA
jgi:hypothetical protein